MDREDATMSAFELSFGVPRDGWIEVELRGPNGTIEIDPSDVPADSIRELASGALKVATETHIVCEVDWHLEPAWVKWRLSRSGERVRFEVQANPDEELVPVAMGSMFEVLLPIWRGLHNLEKSFKWETDQLRHWSHTFPSKEVTQLGDTLRPPSN